MIIEALARYFDRAYANGELPTPGWLETPLDYVIVIDGQGHLIEVEPNFLLEGKKRIRRTAPLPAIGKQAIKHTNAGNDPNILWDNAGFVIGLSDPKKGEKDKVKAAKKRDHFVALFQNWFSDEELPQIHALNCFYEHLPALVPEFERKGVSANDVVTFRLAGSENIILHDPVIKKLIDEHLAINEKGPSGYCMISGEEALIAQNHYSIKNVRDTSSDGPLVAFNADAFTSYNKKNGLNSPVSNRVMIAYTTALNYLLRNGSRQRMQVGDASTVFWSDGQSELETKFALIFQDSPKDDPNAGTEVVRNLYSSVKKGSWSVPDGTKRFYILGLAPNAARIAVRFWHVSTVADVSERIARYFDELNITGYDKFGWPSLFRLLVSISVQEKADNIPPNLAGDTMRAILEDLPFPAMLLQAAIRRCRASQSVNYYRAALIKAVLNRSIRKHKSNEKELTVALDM